MTTPAAMDAPAELRLIVRKYAQYPQLSPGEDPSMCLCNYNTGKLHDGAMAMVPKARQSPGPFGEQAMYVFRRDENLAWTGPELHRIKSRIGGGVWYRLRE